MLNNNFIFKLILIVLIIRDKKKIKDYNKYVTIPAGLCADTVTPIHSPSLISLSNSGSDRISEPSAAQFQLREKILVQITSIKIQLSTSFNY